MGAASADRPAIMVTAGPMLAGRYQGARLGACTDCRRFWSEYRAGTLDAPRIEAIQGELFPSTGNCMVMGTASTMAALTEALGMTLPGMAAIPAPMSGGCGWPRRRGAASSRWSARTRPSAILTRAAFENAVRVLMAFGGSTNAVVHLPGDRRPRGRGARSRRLRPPGPGHAGDRQPRPSGTYHMEDLAEAGGVPAVMKVLAPLLHSTP